MQRLNKFYHSFQGMLSIYKIQKQILSMSYSRYQAELQISRRIALEHNLDLSKRRVAEQALQEQAIRQQELKRLRVIEKVQAEREYQELQLKRVEQQKLAEEEIQRQKLVREAKMREYQNQIIAQRHAREVRETQLEVEQKLAQEDRKKAADIELAALRLQLEKKQSIKQEIARQQNAVLSQQSQQQKLEKELCEIDIAIGTIKDARDARKKRELQELEDLDKKNFKLKQAMRSSKVKQQALEESLAQLSKLIV